MPDDVRDLDAPVGAATGVGGATPGSSTSSPVKDVYFVDNMGYEYSIDTTIDEYIKAKKKVKGITDKYVISVLEELAHEYISLLSQIEALKEIEQNAWREGCDTIAAKLQEEIVSMRINAQSELVRKTYEKLPVVRDDLTTTFFVIILADGRKYRIDWEHGLKIWKVDKWKVVEVKS